jgi:hydroxymethylpyrimidine pyrophosphatase-like HAD family hydrolase
MLDWAGTGVLMGNATEELRMLAPRRGWRIGPTNVDDGVAVMLEQAIAASEMANMTADSIPSGRV